MLTPKVGRKVLAVSHTGGLAQGSHMGYLDLMYMHD